jgi:hypothetical protein
MTGGELAAVALIGILSELIASFREGLSTWAIAGGSTLGAAAFASVVAHAAMTEEEAREVLRLGDHDGFETWIAGQVWIPRPGAG